MGSGVPRPDGLGLEGLCGRSRHVSREPCVHPQTPPQSPGMCLTGHQNSPYGDSGHSGSLADLGRMRLEGADCFLLSKVLAGGMWTGQACFLQSPGCSGQSKQGPCGSRPPPAPRVLPISRLGRPKARGFWGIPSETTLDAWAGALVTQGAVCPCQGTWVAGQSCSSLF